MLVRIVKMSFHQEHIETFLSNFNKKKEEIRKSAGCNLLELYRDKNDSSIFFTYSYWDSEEDLNEYIKSELFNEILSKTKVLFNSKPHALSVEKKISLN